MPSFPPVLPPRCDRLATALLSITTTATMRSRSGRPNQGTQFPWWRLTARSVVKPECEANFLALSCYHHVIDDRMGRLISRRRRITRSQKRCSETISRQLLIQARLSVRASSVNAHSACMHASTRLTLPQMHLVKLQAPRSLGRLYRSPSPSLPSPPSWLSPAQRSVLTGSLLSTPSSPCPSLSPGRRGLRHSTALRLPPDLDPDLDPDLLLLKPT